MFIDSTTSILEEKTAISARRAALLITRITGKWKVKLEILVWSSGNCNDYNVECKLMAFIVSSLQ